MLKYLETKSSVLCMQAQKKYQQYTRQRISIVPHKRLEMGESSRDGNFVTVVSIGTENLEEKKENLPPRDVDFVTVLRIGENPDENEDITEEVLVYRLPGERLGFGLKFEGGTKATEYVKRLFIQSCAPDSPASRVLSSWGNLIEGDEVLMIDSHPVNSMTRMDCVKYLKDSNVIIKLLVRHFKRKVNISDGNDAKSEDLPQVISAEKKKLPPPPPPVPPRKVPRKLIKSNLHAHNDNKKENVEENPLPPVRQKYADSNNNGTKTRSSKKKATSPDPKRNRKYSDGSLGPPDAEFYTDLFSQESLHSLSESDDTASTISTVIDRNSNSLPSTPKSIQKQLDISNFPDDDELFNLNSDGAFTNDFTLISEEAEDDVDSCSESKTRTGIIAEYKTEDSESEDVDFKKNFTVHDENMNIFSLPRLVDFVPKTSNELDQIRMMNLFLESERSDHCDFGIDLSDNNYKFDGDIEAYPKWSVSPQLATIGEVEEESNNSESLTEGSTSSTTLSTPIVIVENADEIVDERRKDFLENTEDEVIQAEKMEPLPSDSRQPPDGHEFPDYEENFQKTNTNSLFDKLRLNYPNSIQNIKPNINQESSFEINSSDSLPLNIVNSMSNSDLGAISRYKTTENEYSNKDANLNPLLYTRSQSLCDISLEKKNEQWQAMVEQRRKSLSKLKGLVIPDSISESDCSSTINLPEIKSSTSVSFETFNSLDSSEASNETSQPSSVDSSQVPLISPPWTGNLNFPKYSPAFKRKDLQLYATAHKEESEESDLGCYKPFRNKKSIFHTGSSSGDDSTAPLKSVDSSPTRSESSFECITSKNKIKPRARTFKYSMETSFLDDYSNRKKEINTEDESDNDSAVSSSQSSFISRPTTSPSPTRSIEFDNNTLKSVNSRYRSSEARHLKPASVEAINRKNILASAKCRSGKDLKVGSPVINRKLEESDEKTEKTCDEECTLEVKEENIVQPKKTEDCLDSKIEEINATHQKVGIPQLITTRLSPDIAPNLPLKPSTALLKTKFETLAVPQRPIFARSISKDSAPVYKEILKLTPVTRKREEKISRFANTKSLSVNDLRKNFENIAKTAPVALTPTVKKAIPLKPRKTDLGIVDSGVKKSDEEGAKVPEARPRSLIDKKSSDVKPRSGKCHTIILKSEGVGGNLGITLAGGIDENKEITVHRIRYGSVAYQEGSLTKGDHIIAINGVETKDLSHFEAVELLKTPAKSFIINVEIKEEATKETSFMKRRSFSLDSAPISNPGISHSPKKANHEIILKKDSNGLGFSIEGGKDSPQGDVPLIVKKIFQGGVADKDGRLKIGDEILSINDINFTSLTRIQAWTMMKKIEIGNVKICIFR